MKNILKVAPVALCLGSMGCEDMLVEEPASFITTETYYNTAADIDRGLQAAYNSYMSAFNSGNYGWWGSPNLASDQEQNHPTEINLAAYGADRMHLSPIVPGRTEQAWSGFWASIYRVNLVLDRSGSVEMSAAEKAAAEAEGKFLRGWAYQQLDKGWSSGTKLTDLSVPLKLSEADHALAESPRNTVAEVHAQVLKDLTEAEAALPTRAQRGSAGRGRATKGAAQMALAEFFLWRSSFHGTNEWQLASDWAKKVIDSGQYSLVETGWFNIFNASVKASNPELIFFMVGSGVQGRQTTNFVNRHAPRDLPENLGGGNGSARATAWHVLSYAPGDIRGNVGPPTLRYGFFENDTVAYRNYACAGSRVNQPGWTTGPNGGFCGPLPFGSYYPYKFRPREPLSNRGDVDLPIYRLAEAYLIYAEAQNELNNPAVAIANLNVIRARARRGTTGNENRAQPADLSAGLAKLQLREAVYMERNWELAHEAGKRWFDLVRRDVMEPGYWLNSLVQHDPNATSVFPNLGDHQYKKRFPIAQREIDLAPEMVQNPGY